MTHHREPEGKTSPCIGGNDARLMHKIFTTKQSQQTQINGDAPILIQGHIH